MAHLLKAALKIENAFHEYRMGISTRGLYGFAPGDWSHEEHIYYGTVPFRGIFRILDFLDLKNTDVVVDLGCGKGRVLCCAAMYSVQQVIGVDDTRDLCDVALNNLRRLSRKRAPAAVIHGKAEQFDYSLGTVFYLFHPFGPNTLRSVISRMSIGLRQIPRLARLAYVNPRHDSVLKDTGVLERYEHWAHQTPQSRFVCYPVSFWRFRI